MPATITTAAQTQTATVLIAQRQRSTARLARVVGRVERGTAPRAAALLGVTRELAVEGQ
jgi:hypothetical protein